MSSALDVATVRLRNQRLVGKNFRDPVSVVRWLGAVQSQDYPPAKWGLGLRGTGFGDAEVEAAFNRGDILRTHVLRPTWHFVTPADIRWMLKLTGPRVHAVLASYYRNMEIDRALFIRSAKIFERALRDGQTLTRGELGATLGRAGIAARGVRLAFFTIYAELEGVICSGPQRGKALTYALLDERAPKAAELSADEALAELTRRYFTSHGPATVRDCSWWSGLTQAHIKRGIEALGKEMSTIEIDGLTCWFAGRPPRPSSLTTSAHLVPTYDELLIAYQDRQFITRHSVPKAIYTGRNGYIHHVIVDGRMAGSWKRTEKADMVTVAIAPFGRIARAEKAAIRAAAERYGTFLNKRVSVSGL